MNKIKKLIEKYGLATTLAILVMLTLLAGLTSCNVTRTITTESSSYQRGDTTVMITTRTTESYDAVKRGGIR